MTQKRSSIIALLALLLLSACFISTILLTRNFEYSAIWQAYQVYLYVGLMCLSGLFFFILIHQLWQQHSTHHPHKLVHSLRTIFVLGLLARLAFVPTNAVLEDDFYRYFFDGSIVTQGFNPYDTAPNDLLQTTQHRLFFPNASIQIPPQIAKEPLMARVAYPDITSIYPPVAQVFFALSSVISPFDLYTWRALLVLMEMLTFYLIVKLLQLYKRPLMLVAIYWLNPLVITEGVNAAHMDVLIPPFLLGALLCFHKQQATKCALLLAGAVGIKLWPLLLAPILIATLFRRAQRGKNFNSLIGFTSVFAIASLALLLPQLISFHYDSGLHQYGQYWQVNSFLFSSLNSVLTDVYNTFDVEWLMYPSDISRLVTASILLAYMCRQAYMTQHVSEPPSHIAQKWLHLTFLLFILSPTGYPWYALWFLPLLCLAINRVNWPIILLTMSLPLYDLRYPELSSVYFENWIVPITFAPVIAILVWQYVKDKSLKA